MALWLSRILVARLPIHWIGGSVYWKAFSAYPFVLWGLVDVLVCIVGCDEVFGKFYVVLPGNASVDAGCTRLRVAYFFFCF